MSDAPPRAPGELAEIDPAWFVLAKMRINLSAGNGIRLSKDELEKLAASPIGPLMDAARAYGAGTAGEVMPDPRLMRGAELALRASGDGGEAKGWRPIETAPMTTDPILVAGLVFADDDWNSGYLGFWRDAPAHKARERYSCIGYMVQPASGHRCVGHRNGPINVTHWMPLPDPPALSSPTKIEGADEL
ncbi:hypothetical protein [Methylobacterium pseudosasicola]|uniref:DUF551 domain-containing protein n=1 Tax=Methylobacterium pseudosasicola TaxID=582667 RepID=A0A1I4V6X2_9HYPH|nr:hypothetical protein [Methylobacterium pseudosasicola]SFM96914.1 hypothetical protein SAMN05192568_10893 [Methylobacterium pseudosasicola]